MSKAHDRERASQMQAQNPQTTEILLVSQPSPGGGEIPMRGRFTATRWANILGCTRKTVERYVEKYDIEYRPFGDAWIIDAVELWSKLPPVVPSKRSKRQRE